MRLGLIVCAIGLHAWKRQPDELGGYGMGTEWFNVEKCQRCPAYRDRVRAPKSSRPKGQGGAAWLVTKPSK